MTYRNKTRRASHRPVLTEKLLQSLLGLYRLLRAPLPIDALLQTILDTALDCIPGAQRGSLMVREGDAMCFRATAGYDLDLLRPVRFPVAHLLKLLPPGTRFTQVESYQEWDATYLDEATNQILQDHGRLDEIRRSLMTSIIVSGTFYGTLVVDNLYSHAPFPAEAESLAALFAEQAGAERVGAVVRNLQIFARQQRSGASAIQINTLINQTLALKQSELALDRIDVRKQLAADLPATWGDAGRISQVLLNLLINAQHALREQAALSTITIRSWAERLVGPEMDGAERIYITIADNGPGIAADVMPRIFEPFFTTKPVGQGTGLGLSVCYGIIADHGGRIWAESQPGHGTTFLIELPVRVAVPEQSVLAAAHAGLPGSALRSGALRSADAGDGGA